MEWVTGGRSGYLGRRRNERYQRWNIEFGKDGWRLAWKMGEIYVDLHGACVLYEDGYYQFLIANPDVLDQLLSEASNVYDDEPSNVESGFDYTKQETQRTHLQDIAIRRCILRMGKCFRGEELIQIRDERGTHPLSITLSPGRVPLHRPGLIEQPELEGWWQSGSVESFYQSNRFLQVREDI